MEFLDKLNPQQREAVCHFEGPLLILAGAGSGKTRVITHRVCHLVHHHRIPGHSILAVTFTNKAAGEMRDRIGTLLAGDGILTHPVVSTFHSFCVRLLRRDSASLADLRPGFKPSFLIYDDDDQLATVKAVFRNLGLDDKFMPYRAALSRISHAKNHQQTPQDAYQNASDPKSERLAVIFEQYEDRLRQANALDFDDLLLEAVRLLRNDETVRRAYNNCYRFLLVDEYQDTNRCQYDLMRLLSHEHANVCAVGDEDQSIYGWRGADIRNILDFERDFPEARTIRLEQNYRSTGNILKAAGAVVENNTERKGKTLWTKAGAGERISLYQASDAEQEALFIAGMIEQLLAERPQDRVAVLYRTNSQSRQIEEALRRSGRDYVVVGGLSFYQRAEVKDILAYLKLTVSPNDPVSLQRIINRPARGIGRTTLEQIEGHARRHHVSPWQALGQMLDEKLLSTRAHAAVKVFYDLIRGLAETAAHESVSTLLKHIIRDTGYLKMLESAGTPDAEARTENLDELVNAAAEAASRGEGPAEFLDHAALVSDSDGLDQGARVSLLTLHNAKGLEWPIVFIAGAEDGLFPHSRSLENEAQMEEERRLCYVGMTRAERRLILTWARARRKFGGGPLEPRMMSRFLLEIPKKYVQRLDGAARPAAAVPELDLFAEQHSVRESVKKNTYTGKTYNSLENISQFFRERGLPEPPPKRQTPPVKRPPVVAKTSAPKPARGKSKYRAGITVEHPRYGRGLVLRREGDGDEAKLTVSFPGHGLKKLIAKYAKLKASE